MTITAEPVTAQLVMSFWLPEVPGICQSAIFPGIMFGLSVTSARGFGESELWFTLVKVVTVVIFISIGLATVFGIMRGVESPGFGNFIIGGTPFVSDFQAMVEVAIIASFSFQSTELIGIAAGELENSQKNIPTAIRQTFWRIPMFHILAILMIGMLIPYTDPNPLKNGASDISVPPFTLLFERAGFAAAAGMMDAVILSTIPSAGNSGTCASTRMLCNLALEGETPYLFSCVSCSDVPHSVLYTTTLIDTPCFLTSAFGDGTAHTWPLDTLGVCSFIVRLGIVISHYHFRRSYLVRDGRLENLLYRAKLSPLNPLFAFALCMVITLGRNYRALVGERIDWVGLLTTCTSLPLFPAVWLEYHWRRHARFVRYHEMDVSSTNT